MKNNVVKGSLCCAGCVINVGFSYLMTNLAGLLCVPLMTKLGCAYTDIAMIWTTLSLGAVIARAFQGQLYDKFNPKIVTLLGAFSYIFGLCGLAFVKTPMQAVLLYVLVGMSNSFCGSLPFALLGSKWIGVGRGTIVGLTGAFAGIITIFISPLAAKMVNIAGFETVAIASGLILGGLHVVSTLLFVCRPPEAYGMSPIDIHFLAPKNNKNSAETAVYETRMPIKELFKLPVFWIVLVLPAFIAITQSGFYSNRSGIWTEMGLSLEQIGTLGGVFTLCNAIFVWVFGFLSDKIGFRKTVLGFAVLGVVVYALYPVYAGLGYAAAFAMAIFFNVGQINAYFGPNVMLPLFGKNKSNVTISWSSMIASAGAMLAPVVVKFAGSYNNFFIIGAVIYVIVLVLTIIATMPSSLQKIKDVDAKYVEAHGITETE